MNTSECAKEAAASTSYKSAASEYARRLQIRQRQLASFRKFHRRLWIYLGAAVSGGMAVMWAALSSTNIQALDCVALRGGLVFLRALGDTRSYTGAWSASYALRTGMARLNHQWHGRGVAGDELLPVDDAYASDLDLVGAGSLFELLCTARTGIGQATLANWLLYPARCEEVTERQGAIAELRGALDLREEWASIKGGDLDRGAMSLREWVNAPAVRFRFMRRHLPASCRFA